MKLTKANVEQNRKFHELPEEQRLEFLLKSYSELFPTDDSQRGDFTPVDVDISKLDKGRNRDERFAEGNRLNSNIDRLNFLMTRLNMTGNPQYEDQIRELALLRFEYMFMAGDSELTQDPKLVADFFRKRGKSELIKPKLTSDSIFLIKKNHYYFYFSVGITNKFGKFIRTLRINFHY